MRCTKCGAEIVNGSQYCQVCGAPVGSNPQQINMQATMGQQQYPHGSQPYQQSYQQQYQQQYQQPYQQTYQQNNGNISYADAGIGLKILSLLIPLVGLILWLVKKDKEPVAAKNCLIWAAVGFGISIVFGALI